MSDDVVVLHVRDGELEPESWVYAWLRPDGRVVYVGAEPEAEPSPEAERVAAALVARLSR